MHIVLFFGVFIMNMYVFSLVDAETLTWTTSTGVIVTVDNVVLPPSANLILNPSFELWTSFPTNWSQGWYGTNTRIFTYPATGIVGSKSVKVDMTSYTDGDAKWYFDDVNVTAGIEYTYSQKYISTIPSHIFARYKSNGGAYSYVLLQSLPVASTPTQVGVAFTPPAGTTSLTLWNAISQVGSLTLDDVSLTFNTSGSWGTGTTDTVAPTVNVDSPVSWSTVSETISITATAIDDTGVVWVQFKIDGTNIWTEDTSSPYSTSFETTLLSNGTHTITATARDAAWNTFTSTGVIVTVDNVVLPPSANLILNPSVETSINAWTRPASWFKWRYGNNDTTFVYPVSGIDGNKAININITRHVDGNAKWYFADVAVSTGVTYRYTQDYISTVPTEIEARYRDASWDYTYALLKSLIAKPSGWSVDIVITPPIGTVSMTLWNSIAQVGSLTTDNYSITPIELPSFSEGMVTFSFDDGFQSIYDKAIPILDAAGIKSTQAIITNALDDTPLYMTSQQVLELFLNGHEIASHTKSHASLISLSAPDAIS